MMSILLELSIKMQILLSDVSSVVILHGLMRLQRTTLKAVTALPQTYRDGFEFPAMFR